MHDVIQTEETAGKKFKSRTISNAIALLDWENMEI